MSERRPEGIPEQPPKAPPAVEESAYTEEEEAEVQKRLEELGYVE